LRYEIFLKSFGITYGYLFDYDFSSKDFINLLKSIQKVVEKFRSISFQYNMLVEYIVNDLDKTTVCLKDMSNDLEELSSKFGVMQKLLTPLMRSICKQML